MVESDKMDGVERIYFPGEIEQLTEDQRLKDGIPYVQDEIDALNAEADKLGVTGIRVLA